MNESNAAIAAGILAGGSSRRMGRPKALLKHPAGGTLIEHVYNVCLSVTCDVVVLGKSDILPPSLAGVGRLADVVENGGPLAGLCSLLEYAAGRLALLVACDMPRLSAGLLDKLVSKELQDSDVRLFQAPPLVAHTCCALYHPRIIPAVREALSNKEYSLQSLVSKLMVDSLQPTAETVYALFNVNTPEDYDSFLRSETQR